MIKVNRHLNPFTPVFCRIFQVDEYQQKERHNQKRQRNCADSHDIDKDILTDVSHSAGKEIGQSTTKALTGEGRSSSRFAHRYVFLFPSIQRFLHY